MKKISILFAIFMFVFFGCKKEETTSPVVVTPDPIIGTWVSEGANVAYGLRVAPFKVKKIVATFNSNKSYTVVQTDSSNVNTTLSGTFASDTSSNGTIRKIVCTQATPSAVTATGIYQVNTAGTGMTYEVIQTQPALTGVTAPTAAEGFGSTKIAGTKYAIYIQTYVKQ